MKPAPFEYRVATSVEEAVALLAEYGDEAKALAGGQSLVPLMVLRLATPRVLVDLNRIPDLEYARDEGERLVLGALARHRTVEAMTGLRDRCPLIAEAVDVIGHPAFRTRGTVGGSVAHADPAAEWPTVAVALDGVCRVAGPRGERAVDASDFFLSYFTPAIEPDELLTEVELRLPPPETGSAFLEVARRHGDFALAGVAALLGLHDGRVSDARIALMSASATPVRAAEAESMLTGNDPSDELIREAADAVDGAIDPVGDIHASSDLRRHLAKVLAQRALTLALQRARGGGSG